MLSAGPTPEVDTEDWEFTIRTESGVHRWNWDEFMALEIEDVDTDIHCVTHWSKLGTPWRGVSLDTLFEDVETEQDYVMAHSYGGYTTNVPLDELLDGKAGSRSSSTASRSTPSTAGRRGCSCRTCTSGRARSGCAGS